MAVSAYTAAGLLKKNPLLGTALASGAAPDLTDRFMTLYRQAVRTGALGRNEFMRELEGDYSKYEGDMMHKISTAEETLPSIRTRLEDAVGREAQFKAEILKLNKKIEAVPQQLIQAKKGKGPNWKYISRHDPTKWKLGYTTAQKPYVAKKEVAQQEVDKAISEQSLANRMLGETTSNIQQLAGQLQGERQVMNTYFGGQYY